MCNLHLEGYLLWRIKINIVKIPWNNTFEIMSTDFPVKYFERSNITYSWKFQKVFLIHFVSYSDLYLFFFFFGISTWWKWRLLVTSPSASHAVSALARLPGSQGPLSLYFVHHKADSVRPQGCLTCSTWSCCSLQSQALGKSIQPHHHKTGLFMLSCM